MKVAVTQTSTPTCALDQLGSAITIDSVIRAMAMLWSVPASLLAIAGYRFVFDRPPAAVVATYVDVSRGLVPALTAFTLVIGGIWLVRSGRSLSPGAIRDDVFPWSTHLWLGLVAVACLGGAHTIENPAMSATLALVAATSGFLAGMAVPRWLHAIGGHADRVLSSWMVLVSMMVFEVTIGWLHSATLVDGASILSGSIALVRGVVMCGGVAAVVVWAYASDRRAVVAAPDLG